MKKIVFILQMIVPYVFVGVRLYTGCVIGTKSTALLERMDKNAFYVLLIVCILNSIYPFLARKAFQAKELLFWSMLIKIITIPFYLLVFIIGIAAITTIRGIIALPVLGLLDYLVLLPSSMIAINGFLLQKRNKEIHVFQCVLFLILEFFFCTDLAVTIYGYYSAKTREK